MNSWASEQYTMNSDMMHPPAMGGTEWQSNTGSGNFIGPVHPNEATDLVQGDINEKSRSSQSRRSGNSGRESRWNRGRDNKDNNRDRDGGRDRGRRRSTDRDRSDEPRNRNERRRENRERVSRFGPRDEPANEIPGMGGAEMSSGSIIMPGMMPFGNTIMQHGQTMDTSNMNNMTMPNMAQMMPNMNMQPNINMQPNMNMPSMMGNMMTNMMDPNMMMAQQQMQMMPQPIFIQAGVLLPPIPGISLPKRRERPPGCRTIFVGGLPSGIFVETITEIFQRFGEIDDAKMHSYNYRQDVCHVRFVKQEAVEQSFLLSGFRFKTHEQSDSEATTIFIDYALNRDDQAESEKQKRGPTPPRIEPFSPAALTALIDKIKSDTEFAECAPTLVGWLEKGECNKKNANTFYSLLQACNNQVRRLYNEKMTVDEEYYNMKSSMKDKFALIICQFEQVAKILTAAKHKRASDHFSKQQRRNIEMWLKMTEDLENLKEEFNTMFDEEETEKNGQKLVPAEKYEQLKVENDSLICELEGYRNEAHMARDEAERKFEKFKAHFIAQQALHGGQVPQVQGGVFPPLPPPPTMPFIDPRGPPTPDEINYKSQAVQQETKLVAMLTAFLLAHPLGATIDYLSSYVRSMVPSATTASVNNVLNKHGDIFSRQNDRWNFVLFDFVKKEIH